MTTKIIIESQKDNENIKLYLIKSIIITIILISCLLFSFFILGSFAISMLLIPLVFIILFSLYAFVFWGTPRYETYIDTKMKRIISVYDVKFNKSTYIIEMKNIKKVEVLNDNFNSSIIQLHFFGYLKSTRFFPRWQYKSPILLELSYPIKPIIEYKEGLGSISFLPLPDDHKEGTVNNNPQVKASKYFIISDINNSIFNEYRKYKK